LNLATANRVFLVEPQWNPSVENQAVARALRLGQEQAVIVTRYVVDETVELVCNDLDYFSCNADKSQTMRDLQDAKLERANLVERKGIQRV
jgi:SWI/SNF-related matrix-associated actin-dependent regulator of chromatin subfamily A3